jgi:hypothetical protein
MEWAIIVIMVVCLAIIVTTVAEEEIVVAINYHKSNENCFEYKTQYQYITCCCALRSDACFKGRQTGQSPRVQFFQ